MYYIPLFSIYICIYLLAMTEISGQGQLRLRGDKIASGYVRDDGQNASNRSHDAATLEHRSLQRLIIMFVVLCYISVS
jgi:hypothetical protein